MQQYSTWSVCVKCGHENPTSKWDEGDPDPRRPRPESIVRTCYNCGYNWCEAPLDADSTPNITENLKEAAAKARRRQTEYIACKVGALKGEGAKAVAEYIRGLAE